MQRVEFQRAEYRLFNEQAEEHELLQEYVFNVRLFEIIANINTKYKVSRTPDNQLIYEIIDQLWLQYDEDRSGSLDKNETKKLVKEFLG